MKNTLKIHTGAKRFLITGTVTVLLIIIVSTVLYIGAGRLFDYYIATDISEKLLAASRPVSVAVCAGSVGIEYFLKRKNH